MNGLGQLLATIEVEYREALLKQHITEQQKLARYMEERRKVLDKYSNQAHLFLGDSSNRVLTEILDNTLLNFECEQWRSLQITMQHIQFPQINTINHRVPHEHAKENDILCYRSKPSQQTKDKGHIWHGRIVEVLTHGFYKRRYLVASLELKGDYEMVYGSQIVGVIASTTPSPITPPLGTDVEFDTVPDLKAL